MTFLTIFTAPKPFTNPHIDIIQRNALQSWQNLGEDVEVLMIGKEEGMAAIASEYGIKHLPDVTQNEWGTPLVSSIFQLAREASSSPVLVYVNADILLMPDFVQAARCVHDQARKYLVIGRRWDLDVTEPMAFPEGWSSRLRSLTLENGFLHPPAGSDYFIYPRGLFENIPDFAIGRAGWDNWMIYYARKQGWAAVDATPDVMIVHQNHDYSHLPGGKPHYNHEESHINVALARGPELNYTGFMVLDTNRELRTGRVQRPRFSLIRWIRAVEVSLMPKEKTGLRWSLVRQLRRWRRRLTGSKE